MSQNDINRIAKAVTDRIIAFCVMGYVMWIIVDWIKTLI